MSFVDDFLDLSASIPHDVIRRIKQLKETDEKAVETSKILAEKKALYLKKLKNKNDKSDNSELSAFIDSQYQEALALADYKQDIIRDLQYILFEYHQKKLEAIIEKGEKEVKNSQINGLAGIIPLTSSYLNDKSLDDSVNYGSKAGKKHSDNYAGKAVKDGKMTGKKKNRAQKMKNKNAKDYTDNAFLANSLTVTEQGIGDNEQLYCFCKGVSFGNMIGCDNPNVIYSHLILLQCPIQWFHYDCVQITEQPKGNWYCTPECQNKAMTKEEKAASKKKKKK